MTEAVEGDLLSKLKALHRDRQIRISEITDNGWFPMRDEAIDVLFAAISRAEAEREDFRSRLATQCGHTLALITTGEALLTAMNNSDTTTAFWNERKALHQALQNARAAGLSRTSGS